MNTYILERKQLINTSLKEAWSFFSSPENLDLLTPNNMGFRIMTPKPIAKMHEGQILKYTVSPILNIPMKWVSKISQVKESEFFIDEQLKGPYKLWRHSHTFKEVNGKTEMTDIVEYALPFDLVSGITNKLLVRKRLDEIFDYRYNKVEALFN